MKIGILDVETTGLDHRTDKITEVGFIIFDVDSKMPIWMYSSLNDPRMDIPEEVVALNGITNKMCKGEKVDFELLKKQSAKCTYILAHHALFDMKFILTETKNKGGFSPGKWLCTEKLIDWTKVPGVRKSRTQSHLGADLGIFNTFPHRALFDAATLGQIVFKYNFLDEMVKKARSEWWFIAATDAPFNKKDILKEHQYRPYYKEGKFKWWYKIVSEYDGKAIEENEFLLSDVYPAIPNPKDAVNILAKPGLPFRVKKYDHWYQPLLALEYIENGEDASDLFSEVKDGK